MKSGHIRAVFQVDCARCGDYQVEEIEDYDGAEWMPPGWYEINREWHCENCYEAHQANRMAQIVRKAKENN